MNNRIFIIEKLRNLRIETKRDLLRGYKREQMQRAMGVLEGINMVKSVIRKQIAVHSSVTHLKGGG